MRPDAGRAPRNAGPFHSLAPRHASRGPYRITLAALFLAALVAGLTADAWNPCAGDAVCVIAPYTGGNAP